MPVWQRMQKQGGYYLNPDIDFVKGLINGLIVNERRYGYQACPCRLAADDRSEDLDIICPCNYRDADITESGACYCALYVSKAVIEGKQELEPQLPERRPPLEERQKLQSQERHRDPEQLSWARSSQFPSGGALSAAIYAAEMALRRSVPSAKQAKRGLSDSFRADQGCLKQSNRKGGFSWLKKE